MQDNTQQTNDLEPQDEPKYIFGLSKAQLINWILFLVIGSAVTALFYLLGNDSEIIITKGSRSIFYWVYFQWGHERYSGNWIILLVAAYIIFSLRNDLSRTTAKPSSFGMLVFIGAIFMHIIGYRTQFPRISLISTIPAYWGLICTIWGWEVGKKLLFPFGYALLCFAASLLQDFTMPLRLYSSALADVLLDGIGIETIREGTIFHSSAGDSLFDVEEGCSGLRSLTAMMALTAPYAYYTLRGGVWRKWTLFAFSIPLAMVSNALRIFTLAAIAEWIGTDLAMMLFHDPSGYIVLVFSILLLIATASILQPRKTEEEENDDDEEEEEDNEEDEITINDSSETNEEDSSSTNKEDK